MSLFTDLFNISEVTLHDGKVQEQDYLLSADVMDAVCIYGGGSFCVIS